MQGEIEVKSTVKADEQRRHKKKRESTKAMRRERKREREKERKRKREKEREQERESNRERERERERERDRLSGNALKVVTGFVGGVDGSLPAVRQHVVILASVGLRREW
jgi:hypothetical protein